MMNTFIYIKNNIASFQSSPNHGKKRKSFRGNVKSCIVIKYVFK